MHFSTINTVFLTLSVVSAFPRQQRANIPCYADNPMRALERFSSEASSFCPKYLASASMALPSDFVQYGSRMTSACSCYEKTAGTVAPTSTASVASSISTIASTTQTSKSSSVVLSMSTPTTKPVVSATSPTITLTSQSTSSSVPLQSSTTSVPSTMGTVASSSASTVPTYVSTGGTAKRGLVYDYNSKSAYANFFTGSQHVSWGSNWGETRATGNGVTIPNSFIFVPTLKVDGNLANNNWNTVAKAAIASGSKYLFA
jgi:hypothetical protein